mgnify:CR=1 FL=1
MARRRVRATSSAPVGWAWGKASESGSRPASSAGRAPARIRGAVQDHQLRGPLRRTQEAAHLGVDLPGPQQGDPGKELEAGDPHPAGLDVLGQGQGLNLVGGDVISQEQDVVGVQQPDRQHGGGGEGARCRWGRETAKSVESLIGASPGRWERRRRRGPPGCRGCGCGGRTWWGAGGRRSALALVARAGGARAVGGLGRAGQAEEAQLPHLHPRPELDGHGGRVGQFQGDVPGEAGVDESGGGVGQQPQAPQARLALQTGGDVVGQGDALVGGAQDELPGVQDEGLVGPDVDEVGQPLLVGGRVDDRVAVVVEETEPTVQAHINGGRLNHLGVVGVEDDPPGVELGADIAV